MKELDKNSEIYYDDETDKSHFCLYWDNDVVSLTPDDVHRIIPIMRNWLEKISS